MEKMFYDYSMLEEDIKSIYNSLSFEGYVPDYVVGLSRGGLVPATCLSYLLQVPLITIQWGRATQKPNLDFCDLVSKTQSYFLVVDDILDTGGSLQTLFQDLEKWAEFDESFVDCGKFRLATLINYCGNKPIYDNMTGQVSCNYFGRTMDERPWVDFFWEKMKIQ